MALELRSTVVSRSNLVIHEVSGYSSARRLAVCMRPQERKKMNILGHKLLVHPASQTALFAHMHAVCCSIYVHVPYGHRHGAIRESIQRRFTVALRHTRHSTPNDE